MLLSHAHAGSCTRKALALRICLLGRSIIRLGGTLKMPLQSLELLSNPL